MTALKGESLKIIFIILLGWSSFACADAVIKSLAQSYNPALNATVGSALNMSILFLVIIKKYGLDGLKWQNPLLCFIRLITSGFISFCIVNALANIPIADMYGITFSSPFIGVVMAYLLLKEQVGWHRWLCVVVGFVGVLIVVGPQFENINNGILFALCSAFLMGVNNTIIRKIGKQENTLNLSFLAFVGMTFVNLFFSWQDISLVNTQNILPLFSSGLLVLGGVCLTTYGIPHAKSAASIAPFLYIQAIWGVVFGYMFFSDIPTTATIVGLLIVIGAGLYMIYREKQLRKSTH